MVAWRSSPRALEDRVLADGDLDVEVTGGARAVADLALARELDAGAGVDPRGDLERQRAAGADAAVAAALVAGVGDDLPEALAGHARAGGHHLAEEAALDLADLAAPLADVAGPGRGAGLHPLAVAGAAADRGVDGQLLLGTEDGVAEVEVEPHEGVLAAGGPRARPRPRHRPRSRRRRRP